jgi:hypothetical protein
MVLVGFWAEMAQVGIGEGVERGDTAGKQFNVVEVFYERAARLDMRRKEEMG